MDDLDHSMHIAEAEWMRFYEECEECALPQPPPASPDNWGLSDLEDSDFTAGHEGQEPPATGDKAKRSAWSCSGGNRSLSGRANDDLSSKTDSESEGWGLNPDCSAINAAEVSTSAAEAATCNLTTSLRPENDRTADDGQKAEGAWQRDTSSTCDPLPRRQGAAELCGSGPRGVAGAASDVPLRAEKERWFVTVNDSPTPQRVRLTTAKKKRLKQPRKNKRLSPAAGWQKLQENHVEFEASNEKARGRDACTNTGLPGPDRAECDVHADVPECCDSDSSAPATGSLEEPGQLLMEPEESAATAPSAAQMMSKTPDADSACGRDTCWPPGTLTSGAQTHEMNSSPSVCCLSADQLSPTPTPVFTPCSPADNPETRAVAAGPTRPVYAISAFWDDMEKLTINNILQLRMARGAPPMVADKSPHVSLERDQRCLTPLDTSDTADSDYFTQLDESKPDHWGGDLSTSDFEEELLLTGASRNSSPDLQQSKQPRASCSPYLADEEGESTASEGMETPVPAGDFTQTCLEDHKWVDLYSNSFVQAQRLVKSKSMHDVRALSDKDLSPRGGDGSRPVRCSPPDEISSEIPFLSNEVASDNPTQESPEIFEDVIGEDKAEKLSGSVLLYDPGPVLDDSLLTFRGEILLTFHHYSREIIPIFSYSRPIIRTFTFPSSVFLNPVKHFLPPLGVVPASPATDGTTAVVPRRFHHNNDSPVTKISLHHKAGIWYRCPGTGMLLLDDVALRSADPAADADTERGAAWTPLQSELAEQQIWETISATRRGGIFSRFQHSDMCLVCIAFASWVLRSADPQSADTWKAALLANISALSAIRYLRQYARQNSSPDGP